MIFRVTFLSRRHEWDTYLQIIEQFGKNVDFQVIKIMYFLGITWENIRLSMLSPQFREMTKGQSNHLVQTFARIFISSTKINLLVQ